jgi:hypothetical protein
LRFQKINRLNSQLVSVPTRNEKNRPIFLSDFVQHSTSKLLNEDAALCGLCPWCRAGAFLLRLELLSLAALALRCVWAPLDQGGIDVVKLKFKMEFPGGGGGARGSQGRLWAYRTIGCELRVFICNLELFGRFSFFELFVRALSAERDAKTRN